MEPLSFLHCSYVPECSNVVERQLTGYFALQFMAQGAVDLSYDGSTRRLEGRWFWPAYPGPRVAFRAAPGTCSWSHRHAAFQGPLLERWWAEGLLPRAAQPAPPGHDWEGDFDGLLADIDRGGRWGTLRAVNRLEGIVLALAEARLDTTPERQPPWLAEVLASLERVDGFSPDYAAIAAGAGMAVSTLRRRFREATGESLHEHVVGRRISRARRLLAESDRPVQLVASELGYRDVYFFSRQFTARVGVSPTAFRRSR